MTRWTISRSDHHVLRTRQSHSTSSNTLYNNLKGLGAEIIWASAHESSMLSSRSCTRRCCRRLKWYVLLLLRLCGFGSWPRLSLQCTYCFNVDNDAKADWRPRVGRDEAHRGDQLSAQHCVCFHLLTSCHWTEGCRELITHNMLQGMLRIMQDAKKQIVYRAIGKRELDVSVNCSTWHWRAPLILCDYRKKDLGGEEVLVLNHIQAAANEGTLYNSHLNHCYAERLQVYGWST